MAPSLLKIAVTWKRAVRSVMERARPIFLLDIPAAIRRSTSYSRAQGAVLELIPHKVRDVLIILRVVGDDC